MKIKRSEVLRLEGAFSALLEIRLEPNAAFKIATNGILANDLAEKIRKTYKPVDGHSEYIEKRQAILAGFESNGASITVPADKAEGVSTDLKALENEYEYVINEQTDYDKKFNELLDVEADIDFEKITMDEIQTDSIEPAKLIPLIQNGIISNGNSS